MDMDEIGKNKGPHYINYKALKKCSDPLLIILMSPLLLRIYKDKGKGS